MIGVVLASVGLVLLIAWWLVWSGRWTLQPHTPRSTRLLLGVWPGLALMVVALGIATAGSELSPNGGNPIALVAAGVFLLGAVATAVGIAWGLLALVRPPRRFDVEWLRAGSRARDDAIRREPIERLRRDRLFMTVAGLAFSAIAVAMIAHGVASGDAALLQQGLVSLAFFGGGALVYLRVTSPQRTFTTPRVQAVPGSGERGVVFPASRASALLFAAGALVFVIAGVAFIADPQMWVRPRVFSSDPAAQATVRVVGVTAVAFFGTVLVLVTPDLIHPFGLALTPHNVVYRAGVGRFSVRWDDIASVHLGSHGNQPTLGLRAADTDRFRLRGLLRLLAPIQRRWFGCDVWISLRGLRCDPDVIAAAVTHLLDHPADRPGLGDPGVLDRLDLFTAR